MKQPQHALLTIFVLNTVFFTCFSVPTPAPPHKLPPGGVEWKNCTRPFELYSCGGACQNTCEHLGEVCPIVNFRCNDSCYCVGDYARNCDGDCIPDKECPPKGTCKQDALEIR